MDLISLTLKKKAILQVQHTFWAISLLFPCNDNMNFSFSGP